MNIDKNLVNRALEAAGQERLIESDVTEESTRWRLIKDNYLSVILSTLSKTTWTCLLTRAPLEQDTETENLTEYGYKYILPIDCARPEALADEGTYIVEGKYLYTDSPSAVLLYVTNGKRAEISDAQAEEDYPEYGELVLGEPLTEYIELLLAAKIALKITGSQETFQLLYQQALIIENNVKKANLEAAHSKEKGEAWWGDRMGLNVEGKVSGNY